MNGCRKVKGSASQLSYFLLIWVDYDQQYDSLGNERLSDSHGSSPIGFENEMSFGTQGREWQSRTAARRFPEMRHYGDRQHHMTTSDNANRLIRLG